MIALAAVVVVVLAVPAAVLWLVGSVASAPQNGAVGPLPADLVGDEVAFGGAPGAPLRGWFLPGRPEGPSSSSCMASATIAAACWSAARFLQAGGYSVLLFDFQAHGESQGDAITFGYRESRNAAEAVAFVRGKRPDAKIAIIGISLGGAAALLAAATPCSRCAGTGGSLSDPRGRHRRSHRAPPRRLVAPLDAAVTWQFAPRLGFGVALLRPIEAIGGIRCAETHHRRDRRPAHPSCRIACALCRRSATRGILADRGRGACQFPRFCRRRLRGSGARFPRAMASVRRKISDLALCGTAAYPSLCAGWAPARKNSRTARESRIPSRCMAVASDHINPAPARDLRPIIIWKPIIINGG